MENKHKSGFVNIIGNPNVGKSTLVNALMGERLSIITSKAQTTRHRILGILNTDEYQIVLSDTPGILRPAYALQETMMKQVKSAVEDADILLYMVEAGEKNIKNPEILERVHQSGIPTLLLINKIDKAGQQQVMELMQYWQEKFPGAEIIPISALEKFNLEKVLERIVELLPEGPPYFPKDQWTDKTQRFFVNERIREKILLHYKKEIPYSVEVETTDFHEGTDMLRIRSVIWTERDSQKGILIGHKGKGLKRVGSEARKDLEAFFGKKIFLELYVKVRKDWRNDQKQLRRFGYES